MYDNSKYDDEEILKRTRQMFQGFIKPMSEKFLTSNLILMWGTDFGHKEAGIDYKIMDKIIEHIP